MCEAAAQFRRRHRLRVGRERSTTLDRGRPLLRAIRPAGNRARDPHGVSEPARRSRTPSLTICDMAQSWRTATGSDRAVRPRARDAAVLASSDRTGPGLRFDGVVNSQRLGRNAMLLVVRALAVWLLLITAEVVHGIVRT